MSQLTSGSPTLIMNLLGGRKYVCVITSEDFGVAEVTARSITGNASAPLQTIAESASWPISNPMHFVFITPPSGIISFSSVNVTTPIDIEILLCPLGV